MVGCLENVEIHVLGLFGMNFFTARPLVKYVLHGVQAHVQVAVRVCVHALLALTCALHRCLEEVEVHVLVLW